MLKAITFKLGKKKLGQNGTAKKDTNRGNRREKKLKKEIKEWHQYITRTSNELSRRKVSRKATKKKKRNLKATESANGKRTNFQ